MTARPQWRDLTERELGIREAGLRVVSVARVTAAMADGTWPTNACCLGTLTAILTDAERFQFRAEFEPAACPATPKPQRRRR